MNSLLACLSAHGWQIETQVPAATPAAVAARGVPSQYQEFVAMVRSCASPDGAVWFNGGDDFAKADGSGWDFLEQQVSLPSAEGDTAWTESVIRFWQAHLPIALNARGDYSYIALNSSGRVVTGWAPELEEPTELAESFDAFVQRVLDECERREGELWELWIGPVE